MDATSTALAASTPTHPEPHKTPRRNLIMNKRKRILSRTSRTPGKALSKDDLSQATGGARGVPIPGCCIQGCTGCDLPGVSPIGPSGPFGGFPF